MIGWKSPALNRLTLPGVDLNQQRGEERRRILNRSRRDALALAALGVFAAVVLVPLSLQVADKGLELARVQRELGRVETRSRMVSESGAETDQRLSRWRRYEQIRTRRESLRDLLSVVAVCIPDRAYLEQVRVEGKLKQVEMTLQGSAEKMETLKRFTDSLSGTPFFTTVRLTETSADPTLGDRAVRFRIQARVAGALANGAAN